MKSKTKTKSIFKRPGLKELLLTLSLFFTSLSFAHDFEVDGIYYEIRDNSVYVTYKGQSAYWFHAYSGDVIIPDSVTYEGKTYVVSGIGSDSFLQCGVTNVTIPSSVKSIEGQAFRECTSLQSIIIPDSVEYVGSCCFYDCNGLTDLYIGKSVTSIGVYAFLRCNKLSSITIPASVSTIGTGALNENSGLLSIIVEEGNKYYDSRENCNAIIETATNKLIQGCKRTTIPNTVDSIEEGAFSWCTGLYNITIPNSVKSIGRTAFWYCTSLNSITIGDSVEYIGDGAFGYCTSLRELIIPNSVINMIGDVCYYCSSLNKVIIGNSVTSIGNEAFRRCNSLRSITIPESVTSIGDYAFSYCYNLSSIVIPNSVTSIGNLAFENCNSLRTVYLTGYNEWLAGELPNTTSNLYIEGGITSLKGIYVSPSHVYCFATVPPTCDGYSFTDYSGTLHVPASSLALYFTAPYWCNFSNIVGDAVGAISISLDKNTLELIIGDSEQLVASVLPSNANPQIFTWSSTDESVAKVINGEVSAIAAGECDIKVSCFNNVETTCHVTVKALNTDSIMIYLDQSEVQVLPNHIVTLIPSASSNLPELQASSNDLSIAAARIINNRVQIVGIKEGITTITVGSADGLAIPATCEVTVYTEPGDVNCDGFINISDVTKLIDYLLSGNPEGLKVDNADTNRDGKVNISDVTTLIDYLLSGRWPYHTWVDLGLPSGTMWATCNVGAENPEDYGDYFAWGETETKDYYYWNTYRWCNGSNNTMTKYCTDSSYGYNGFVDNKTELDPEDDAACVNWGATWRIPSIAQWQELFSNCTTQWTQMNGVNGQLVTGPNGKFLFLPAAGSCWEDSLNEVGSFGRYWSRTLSSIYSNETIIRYFESEDWNSDYPADRSGGCTIRAVRI